MKEIAEFRVAEKYAARLFSDGDGKPLGTLVRRVRLSTDDPKFHLVGDLQREIVSKTKDLFFYGWNIHRKYTKDEVAKSKYFYLIISSSFEPSGEECGTSYDESTACPRCGAGATQVSDLRLDLRRIPKGKDIARTIADEYVVSQRMAESMIDAGLTGFELHPVKHKARYEDDPLDLRLIHSGQELLRKAEAQDSLGPDSKFRVWLNRSENRALLDQARAEYMALKRRDETLRSQVLPSWYQLIVSSSAAEIVPPTRVGETPFGSNYGNDSQCETGDLLGLNLLTEVSVSAKSVPEADIFCSRQFLGVRRGLLRPHRVILISRKFYEVLKSEQVKGAEVEIAHIV